MRRVPLLACAVVVGAAVLPPALAAPPVELPALTRIASKLSGLPAKRKPTVRVVSRASIERKATQLLDRDYPRGQQAYDETLYRALGLLGPGKRLRPALLARHVRGVRGLYDPVSRTIYARAGAGLRSAVLRELLHALQDQTFDLKRMAGLRRSSRDAGLAASAAVEGSAALSAAADTRSFAAARRPSSHEGGDRIAPFLELLAEFPSATGARFASTLHELGGRRAVNGALRRFPETSEQVFHVEAYLRRERPLPILLPQSTAGFTLARDDTFGELDVRALLAVFQVPRLDHAGAGWGGGRTALYRGAAGEAVAVVLFWDTERDALEWAEAVETYVNEAFDADRPGFPGRAACAAEACWAFAGRSIAFARDGASTALVFGPSAEASAALARELA